MRGLKGLLIRKIIFTLVFLCIPLLLFPITWFDAIGIPLGDSLIFVRLLGAAYLALLVGYYSGIAELNAGGHPRGVIHMGIASNGLAAVLLFYFGFSGSWVQWGNRAQVFMWLTAVGALVITLGLFRFLEPRQKIQATRC